MLQALRFVKGAISTKTFEPVLKNFRIKDGRVQAYNGLLSLSSPIECDLDIQPAAGPFVNAIQLCDETVALHLTESGRLALKSGDFRAYIDCSKAEFPDVSPLGDDIQLDGELLSALSDLSTVMGTDASRPWSHGILLAGQSAYVTNNIILIERWLGYSLPAVIGLPAECVRELLRINEEPVRIQSNGQTVSFHFEDGRWMTSAMLNVAQWPDPSKLFPEECTFTELSESLFKTLQELKPFTDDMNSVWLYADGTVATSKEDENGARRMLPECAGMCGRYSADQLLRLRGVAKRIDWSRYPKPCAFSGDYLRGLIIGMHL